ncbi:hypothetical protein QFC19_006788 [Naganishia cerealis]|uniref:Uncharacterized protein n=1 Tax=Naganishia cerealis TaxID=610337 RepID=A0ACC2VDH4_9TREE|nr:hypothetical protein QFC19_006788 [Naganishia cerealis]
MQARLRTTSAKPSTPSAQRKTVTGVRINTRAIPSGETPQYVAPSSSTSSSRVSASTSYSAYEHRSTKTKNGVPSSSKSTEENLTYKPDEIADSSAKIADESLDRWEEAFQEDFAGLSEDAIFKAISRPPNVPGVEAWGIPPPTSEKPSASLQAKVSNFLKLKLEQDRHINTTLLASTAFANPHIYSKLQKAQETALLAAQSSGKRKNIDFTTGSTSRSSTSSRNELPSRAAGKYAQLPPRNVSVEAGEGRSGSRERSKRESRSFRDGSSRPRDDTFSLTTGEEGVSRRYERDREGEGKRNQQSRRWD